jgi:hypothetical protein
MLLVECMKHIVITSTCKVPDVQLCKKLGKLANVGNESIQAILLRQDGGDTLSGNGPDQQKNGCGRQLHLFRKISLRIEFVEK